MLFGEDSLKGLKKELKSTGADMGFVKGWQKDFDKVKKNSRQIEAQYTQAKQELMQVHTALKKMEQSLIYIKEDLKSSSYRSYIKDCVRDMKKYQGSFNHEFLIGKEDKDFHLTYQTLLNLCGNDDWNARDMIILQSEVENILALVEEALEKEWPEYRAMAYFYLERTDKEIADLPHADKVVEVNRIYDAEFLSPMREVLNKSFGEGKAKQILEVDIWN